MRNNLKCIREEKGLSSEAISNKLSVPEKTILDVEEGKYIPSVYLAIRISKELGCELEEIFFENGPDRKTLRQKLIPYFIVSILLIAIDLIFIKSIAIKLNSFMLICEFVSASPKDSFWAINKIAIRDERNRMSGHAFFQLTIAVVAMGILTLVVLSSDFEGYWLFLNLCFQIVAPMYFISVKNYPSN